jgi:SAM-dependent methyltransferase
MLFPIAKEPTSPYDAIAEEYYNPDLHKTSRNFDCATKAAFANAAIRSRLPREGLFLDVGAGRGRVQEFLGVEARRVVQLDDSARMLALEEREECVLRIKHRAESLPFLADQFACVSAFLCDAYVGLDFLAEAFRVLRPGGILVGTVPAKKWGVALREAIKCDLSLARFLTRTEETIFLPSTLLDQDELLAMLQRVGFAAEMINIVPLTLPLGATPVSKDIERPAIRLGVPIHELPLLLSFVAQR